MFYIIQVSQRRSLADISLAIRKTPLLINSSIVLRMIPLSTTPKRKTVFFILSMAQLLKRQVNPQQVHLQQVVLST